MENTQDSRILIMYTVEEFEKKTQEFLTQFAMVQQGQTVTVAFSGGADSGALLFCLHNLRERLQIKVQAVHINHGLRPEESKQEEEYVKQICEKKAIPLQVYHLTEKTPMSGVELWAREQRYTIFSKIAAETKGVIATAHTANDQAETLLLRLIQGTGLKGAGGIPAVRKPYIRPLLWAKRQDIEEYCLKMEYQPVEDSSNQQTIYSRNYVRHKILPLLSEMNPAVVTHLAEYCAEMQCVEEYVAAQGEKLLEAAKTTFGWKIDVLMQAPEAVKNKAIACLCSQKAAPSRKKIQQIQQLMEQGGKISLAKGVKLASFQGLLVWEDSREIAPSFQEIPIKEGYFYQNEEFSLEIWCESCETKKNFFEFEKKVLNYCTDCAKIPNDTVLRRMQPGDRIRPVAGGVSKPLRKFYLEQKVPPTVRSRLPILASQNRVLWVWGYGFAEGLGQQTASNKTLCIRCFCGQKKEKQT